MTKILLQTRLVDNSVAKVTLEKIWSRYIIKSQISGKKKTFSGEQIKVNKFSTSKINELYCCKIHA